MLFCKDCVHYDMCSSLMLERYTALALGIRYSCEYYEKEENALKEVNKNGFTESF